LKDEESGKTNIEASAGYYFNKDDVVWLSNVPEEPQRLEIATTKKAAFLDDPQHFTKGVYYYFYDEDKIGVYRPGTELIRRTSAYFGDDSDYTPDPIIAHVPFNLVVAKIDGQESKLQTNRMKEDCLFEYTRDREGRKVMNVYRIDKYMRPYTRVRQAI